MFRNLLESDREKYIELAVDFYSSDAVCHNIPRENIEKSFDEMIKSDTYMEGFAVIYDDRMVGYGVASKTFSQEAGGIVIWLEELYIEREYRSKGIAGEYFKFVKEHFDYAARFRLEVSADNMDVTELYKRFGFEFLDYTQMVIDFEL